MSRPRTPEKGALVIALMITEGFDEQPALELAKSSFGPIEIESEPFPFEYTSYYKKEMGSGIKRKFILFRELIDQGYLAEIKLSTNEIENQFLIGDSRKINLDPGILLPGRFILATGKDAPHRIYLKDGIFAELTLKFESGMFMPFTWTYPDYKDERTTGFLENARQYYLKARNLPERNWSE